MPSHPSADDMRKHITLTSEIAKITPADSPEHARLHQVINEDLDQMDREGGPSYGQEC